MDIKVKLTLEDYQDFNKSYALRKLGRSADGFKAFLFISIFLLLGYIITSRLSSSLNSLNDLLGKGSQGNSSIDMYIYLIFIGVLIIGTFMNAKNRTKKIYNSNALLRAQQNYSFFDDHIDVNSENGYTRITWEQVNSIAFLKTCYSIFISISQALIIPRRLLSQEEARQLEEIFIRCVPSEKIQK